MAPYLLLLVRRYRVRYRAEAAMTAGLVAESERLAAAGVGRAAGGAPTNRRLIRSRRRFPSVVASPSGGAEDGTRRQGGDLRSGRGISVGLSELFEAIASSTRPQLRVTGVEANLVMSPQQSSDHTFGGASQ